MNFDDLIIKEFEALDIAKFTATFIPPKIFLCGGPTRAMLPESVRQRIIDHYASNDLEVFNAIIQAEDFNDYYKEGIYSDLVEFETDIANISTLVIVCLESPGSFVELGMFCGSKALAKKLLVIAPQEEVDKKNSFIYHGPLARLLQHDKKSVVSYPWADPAVLKYEHLEFISVDIMNRLDDVKASEKFDPENSGHVALLIYDIIGIISPVKKEEIQLSLLALGIFPSQRKLNKLLYLLERIKLIAFTTYSSVDYYYSVGELQRRIKFGTTKAGIVKETPALRMLFRQSYVLSAEESAKKRRYVLESIQKLREKK